MFSQRTKTFSGFGKSSFNRALDRLPSYLVQSKTSVSTPKAIVQGNSSHFSNVWDKHYGLSVFSEARCCYQLVFCSPVTFQNSGFHFLCLVALQYNLQEGRQVHFLIGLPQRELLVTWVSWDPQQLHTVVMKGH